MIDSTGNLGNETDGSFPLRALRPSKLRDSWQDIQCTAPLAFVFSKANETNEPRNNPKASVT